MKISYKFAVRLLVFLIINSCAPTSKKDNIVAFKRTFTLEHKTYDTELLISNGRLAVIDSFLIIVSRQQESLCKVYSIPNNMKELYSYGRIGNGPGEFIQPLLTYSFENTFGLNEVNKQELAIMKLTNTNDSLSIIEQDRLKAPYKMKKNELVPPDYYFVKLNDSCYVSLLLGGKGRFFSLLDSTLIPINQFGESPISEELPVLSSRNRLQGRIAAHDGAMAFATSNLPYISCYQFTSNYMQKKWSFFYDQPYYTVRNNDLLFDKDKSFGKVIGLKMDNQFIYLLYLDQLLSEYDYHDTEKSLANVILVFDHDGNSVAKLDLSCRISEMALSKDEKKIYGIAHLPEPTLVEFLSPLLP